MQPYNRVSDEIIKEIVRIAGKDAVLIDIIDIFPYSMDGTLFDGTTMPELVVQPNTAKQISEILKIATENRIPVVPRGSGTSLAGNPLAIYGGIIIDMRNFDKIEKISIADNMVIAQPGVICDKLNEELKKSGYFFPPDPGSSSAATLGGMVSNNAGGIQAFKYGVTSNYVLWLEVVLPTGEIVEFGSKTLKSTSSLNLTGLMIGSEGTLGIITKIALKIRPLPDSRKSGFYIFEEFESITELIISIRKAGIVPNMTEFLDKTTTKVCFEYLGGEYLKYPLGYFFLVEVDGNSSQVYEEFEEINSLCLEARPIFYKISKSQKDRDEIVGARKAALPALSSVAPTTTIEDCTINITNLAEALNKIEEINEKFKSLGVTIATFGHLEGNLHPTFLFNENDPEQVKNFEKAVDMVYNDVVIPLGGTITGEHGVGFTKNQYLVEEHPTSVELMHKIKQLFDPNLILNPGKGKGSNRIIYSNPIELPQKDLKNVPTVSCMRCGFCVSECPAYQNYRIESYSPRGKLALIKGITRGNLKVTPRFEDILFACTLCGTCEALCPALIQTVELFEGTRALFNKNTYENKEENKKDRRN